jgi:hypothetical protein
MRRDWCFRCGLRRIWACVAAKLEDNHRRRTVMANAKANADLNQTSFGFRGLPPTDFDG